MSAPLKATEGFVWGGSAWRLDFGCSREPCSPDVPFDQVTPPRSVLIIHRQGCDSTPASVVELRAYLWTIWRLSADLQAPDVTCDMSANAVPVPARIPLSVVVSPAFVS